MRLRNQQSKSQFTHTASQRRETTIGIAQCPYFPMPLANINNLKTHIRMITFPHLHLHQNKTGKQHWADIWKKNPRGSPNGHNALRKELRRGPTQMAMGIFYGRIRTNAQNNQKNRHCIRCAENYTNGRQILKHMNNAHNEITRGNATCPFCNKQWIRIIYTKQHKTTRRRAKQTPHLTGPQLWNYIVKKPILHTETYGDT